MNQRSHVDKPLPSPPIAQVLDCGPSQEERGLIDAAEKPLTRSPPGDPETVEEWPVLHPKKSSTPETLLQLTQSTTQAPLTSLTSPTFSPEEERYPAMDNTELSACQDTKKKNVFSHSMPPKAALLTGTVVAYPGSVSGIVSTKTAGISFLPIPRQGGETTSTATTGHELSNDLPSDPPRPADSKSLHSSRMAKIPRHTRTSKVRARLSAGKPSENDTVACHFVSPDDAVTMKEDGRDASSAMSHLVEGKPVLGGSRGPAKMVAGSRRPARTNRQHSQIFARDHRSTNIPKAAPTSDLAPQAIEYLISIETPVNDQSQNDTPELHDSTIVKHPTENVEYHELDSISTVVPQTIIYSSPEIDGGSSAHGFDIFEEPSATASHPHVDNLDTVATTITTCSSSVGATLEAVNGTPRTSFTMKRLSKAAPAHGPTLWISSSAERLIMGEDESNKENIPSMANKSGDLRRGIIAKDLRKSRDGAGHRQGKSVGMTRPATSLGLSPRSPSKLGGSTVQARKKRAQSIDVDYASRTSYYQPSRQTTGASTKSISTSMGEDPFFDARSHVEDSKARFSRESSLKLQQKVSYEDAVYGESTWIAPGVERTCSFKVDNTISTTTEPMRVALPVDNEKSIPEETLNEVRLSNDNVTTHDATLTTPKRGGTGSTSSSSGSFPPRSSSHRAVPDFTIPGLNRQFEGSPLSSAKYLPKEVVGTLDSVNKDVPPALSSQPSVDQVFTKRDSVTQTSTRSRSSVSRSVFSNVRGFFHKRNSDKSRLGQETKNEGIRKSMVTIVKNASSAVPPTGDVHRFDRPTIASASKNKVTARHNPAQSEVMMPTTAALELPGESDLSNTYALAMRIIESALAEPSSPNKERLLELSKIMVHAVTQARDAETSMEQAKQAARDAEMSCVRCWKSVNEVGKSVQDWWLEMEKDK